MKKFFLTLLISLLSIACNEIMIVYPIVAIPGQETADGSIQFGNYTPVTKAMAGEGPNGVGYGDFTIFGFEDNTPIMDPYFVIWQESQWVYEGVSSQEIKYFNKSASQYSFVGVISDKTPSRDGTTVNVSGVESFQTTDPMNSPKELLYTQKIVPQSQFGKYVSLTFNHANARMFIGFASDRADTKIINYAPGTGDVNIYRIAADPIKYYGPTVSDAEGAGLTDADIAEINSHFNFTVPSGYYWAAASQAWSTINGSDWPDYVSSALFSGYWSDNNGGAAPTGIERDLYPEFTGDFTVNSSNKLELNFDGWDYIVTKYPDFANINLSNWSSAVSGGMKLVHVTKENGNLRGWWINTTNTNVYFLRTEPGSPALEGIRVFSVDDSGSPIVHKVHTDKADIHVPFTGDVTYDNVFNSQDVMIFSLPSGNVAQSDDTNIAWNDATPSPTIRYALPIANTGYVAKFSYVYNGVTYYDARVLIPTESAAFAASKDYTYVIYITDKTNGTTDPNQAYEEKNEVDTSKKAIVFSEITFGDYTSGGHYVYTIL